ncbi:MAG: LemA family protein [Gammaproteobacteria bacterium]
MFVGLFVLLAIIVVAVIYGVSLYNGLISVKHNVDKAWSNIDVLLKQRHDELPKLVETCKQYMKYEQETLDKVIRARQSVAAAQGSGDIKALGQAEGALRAGLGQLFALAESYPDLKANENFKHLQARISELENAIADRREFYNESVNINNVRIEQFPAVLLAGMAGAHPRDLLQFDAAEKADVSVKALFE